MPKNKKNPKPVSVQAPKLRTLDEVQKDYSASATDAGDKQYRIEVLKAELSNLNARMLQLNQEAAEINKNAPQTNTVAPGSIN